MIVVTPSLGGSPDAGAPMSRPAQAGGSVESPAWLFGLAFASGVAALDAEATALDAEATALDGGAAALDAGTAELGADAALPAGAEADPPADSTHTTPIAFEQMPLPAPVAVMFAASERSESADRSSTAPFERAVGETTASTDGAPTRAGFHEVSTARVELPQPTVVQPVPAPRMSSAEIPPMSPASPDAIEAHDAAREDRVFKPGPKPPATEPTPAPASGSTPPSARGAAPAPDSGSTPVPAAAVVAATVPSAALAAAAPATPPAPKAWSRFASDRAEPKGSHVRADEPGDALVDGVDANVPESIAGLADAAAGSDHLRRGYGGPPEPWAKAQDPAPRQAPAATVVPHVPAIARPVASVRDVNVPLAQPPAAGEPAEAASQIVRSVRWQWTRGIGDAHVELEPRHFGDARIAVRLERQQVVVRVTVESAVVREWLETHHAWLRDSLASHGLELDRLEIQEPDVNTRDEREAGNRPAPGEERERRLKRPHTGARFEVVA
jgi:hypothetical protein